MSADATAERDRRLIGRPSILLMAAGVLIAIAFTPAVANMVDRWTSSTDYYGHGPLVPLVCAWAVWRERHKLREAPLKPSNLGLLIVLGSILLLTWGTLERFYFFPTVAFFGVLLGTTLAVFGGRVVSILWFPFAFFWFMLPLPGILVARGGFAMKMLAARLTAWCIDFVGIPVALDGSTIQLTSASVTVEEACNGLRTMLALFAMGAIFAFLDEKRIRALVILLLTGPVAVLANVARILILCYLAAIGSRGATEGPLHQLTGLGTFAAAFLLLWGVRWLWPRREDPFLVDEEPSGLPSAPPRSPLRLGRARAGVLLGLLGVGAVVTVGFREPPPEKTTATKSIPRVIDEWTGTDVPIEPSVFRVLETEDVLIRDYQRTGQPAPITLHVVHAADRRSVAHPPEMCFTGSGYTAREVSVRSLSTAKGEIPANRFLLERGATTVLVYYWYRIDGKDTADYIGYQISALWKRLKGEARQASLVRISTPVLSGDVEDAESRISRFLVEALAQALAPIP